jgi:hypothetical protein
VLVGRDEGVGEVAVNGDPEALIHRAKGKGQRGEEQGGGVLAWL